MIWGLRNIKTKLGAIFLSAYFPAALIIIPVMPTIPRLDDLREQISGTRIQADSSLEELRQKIENLSNGEILVKFKNNSPINELNLVQKYSLNNVKSKSLGVYSAGFNGQSIDLARKISELRNDPGVEFAEPNYIARAFFTPNDQYYQYQWNFSKELLDMERVWDMATGKGVKVAVVDTGIAYENYKSFAKAPDLENTIFTAGFNAIANSSHANDDNGHGTHVTGTIAQSTNNNLGLAGMAFNASVIPVKALDRNGSGTYSDIAEGIIWAANNGANVINLSLGGPYSSQTLYNAIKYANSKDVTIVAASGNDGARSVSYPAAYNDYVIAVGATGYDKSVTSYSNQGSSLDLVAPGGDLKMDQDGDGYGDGILQQTFKNNPSSFGYYFFQGTSMAAPHVAAAAALLLEKGAGSPSQIQKVLEETADDIYYPGRDNTSGFGFLNIYKALKKTEENNNNIQVLTSPTPPPTGGSTPSPTPLISPSLSLSPSPTPTPTPSPTSEPTPEPPKEKQGKKVSVESIDLELKIYFIRVYAIAKVKIEDSDGNPVEGALVKGNWSGLVSSTDQAKTDSNGLAILESKRSWYYAGFFSLDIENIEAQDYKYAPEDNKISSKKIEVGK